VANPQVNIYWFNNGVQKLNGDFPVCYNISWSSGMSQISNS
jgi:hypothetical protein